MSKKKSPTDNISKMEAIRAFLEQWGLWKFFAGAASAAFAVLMAGWAYLESQLPYWGIALVFLGAFSLIAFLLVWGQRAYNEWLRRKLLIKVIPIDREALSLELEQVSQGLAKLVTKYQGPLQELFWSSSDAVDRIGGDGRGRSRNMFATKARVEGQMVAEYGEHYAARVWAAIYRARKIVPIDENDLWSISHGIRSPHDLQGLHMFLSKLSVEVLHPPLDSQPISVKRL